MSFISQSNYLLICFSDVAYTFYSGMSACLLNGTYALQHFINSSVFEKVFRNSQYVFYLFTVYFSTQSFTILFRSLTFHHLSFNIPTLGKELFTGIKSSFFSFIIKLKKQHKAYEESLIRHLFYAYCIHCNVSNASAIRLR